MYSIVVVIPLVESSSGLEILHGGEGGDVERWLEISKQISLFVIDFFSLLSPVYSFIHC